MLVINAQYWWVATMAKIRIPWLSTMKNGLPQIENCKIQGGM
jgi:hypothetical protein